MTDANLASSQSAILSRILTLVASASVEDLYKIARTGAFIGEEENVTLEQAINSKIVTLAQTATSEELSKLARAASLMMAHSIVMTSGSTIPAQLSNSGKFLSTDATNDTWGGLRTKNVLEVSDNIPTNGQTLLTNGTKLVPASISILTVSATASLPTSGNTTGDLYYDNEETKLKYWDGSAWTGVGA